MRISRELLCECGKEKSEWANFCDPCRTIEQSKETKQIIVYISIFVVAISLVLATIIEYKKQLGTFFNVLEERYLSVFHTLPDFLQTFLMIFGFILLVLIGIFGLVFLMLSASDRI